MNNSVTKVWRCIAWSLGMISFRVDVKFSTIEVFLQYYILVPSRRYNQSLPLPHLFLCSRVFLNTWPCIPIPKISPAPYRNIIRAVETTKL